MASTWTDEDRAKANPTLQPGINVVSGRHPDDDDTWAVATYVPTADGTSHTLRDNFPFVKCATFEDAQRIAAMIDATDAGAKLRSGLPEDDIRFVLAHLPHTDPPKPPEPPPKSPGTL